MILGRRFEMLKKSITLWRVDVTWVGHLQLCLNDLEVLHWTESSCSFEWWYECQTICMTYIYWMIQFGNSPAIFHICFTPRLDIRPSGFTFPKRQRAFSPSPQRKKNWTSMIAYGMLKRQGFLNQVFHWIHPFWDNIGYLLVNRIRAIIWD